MCRMMNGRQDFDATCAAGRSRSLAVLRKRPEIDDEAVPGRGRDRLQCPDRGLGPDSALAGDIALMESEAFGYRSRHN